MIEPVVKKKTNYDEYSTINIGTTTGFSENRIYLENVDNSKSDNYVYTLSKNYDTKNTDDNPNYIYIPMYNEYKASKNIYILIIEDSFGYKSKSTSEITVLNLTEQKLITNYINYITDIINKPTISTKIYMNNNDIYVETFNVTEVLNNPKQNITKIQKIITELNKGSNTMAKHFIKSALRIALFKFPKVSMSDLLLNLKVNDSSSVSQNVILSLRIDGISFNPNYDSYYVPLRINETKNAGENITVTQISLNEYVINDDTTLIPIDITTTKIYKFVRNNKEYIIILGSSFIVSPIPKNNLFIYLLGSYILMSTLC